MSGCRLAIVWSFSPSLKSANDGAATKIKVAVNRPLQARELTVFSWVPIRPGRFYRLFQRRHLHLDDLAITQDHAAPKKRRAADFHRIEKLARTIPFARGRGHAERRDHLELVHAGPQLLPL